MIKIKNKYNDDALIIPSDDENCKEKRLSLMDLAKLNWYFERDSFQTIGYISFTLYTITKSWRHRNSEGWEKYQNLYVMGVSVLFPSQDNLYLSVSALYNQLISSESLTYDRLETIFIDMDTSISITENTEIMVDCY